MNSVCKVACQIFYKDHEDRAWQEMEEALINKHPHILKNILTHADYERMTIHTQERLKNLLKLLFRVEHDFELLKAVRQYEEGLCMEQIAQDEYWTEMDFTLDHATHPYCQSRFMRGDTHKYKDSTGVEH